MKTVIVDIDGTLSKVGDRVKHLEKDQKDWDAFYEACDEDMPHLDIIELVNMLAVNYYIVLCSGRRESTRNKTIKWLFDNGVNWHMLLLRADGDHRHDIYVKPELLVKDGINLKSIVYVLEDRDSMVAKWREMGLRVLQVAEGKF